MRKYIAIDLEVGRGDGRIHQFAAVRGDRPEFALRSAEGGVSRALQKLDAFAEGAEFVLGHNIIRFDMPRLEKVAGELRMLRLPLVDTLWLSPLCFPRHPYHRLVKHYKDGGLVRTQQNNPESDARLSMQLFEEELEVLQGLQATNPELLAAWHGLCSFEPHAEGLARVFRHVRGSEIPDDSIMRAAVRLFLQDRACPLAVQGLLEKNVALWPLAYALAWLSVAEGNAFVSGNSVMPPWVRHEFPEAGRVVRQLRDERCGDSACPWCAEHHNPVRMLNRWFGYPGFRPVPAFEDGRPMQQAIVETAMAGEDVLGILPTGTGKSLCYQIPALSRYLNTGALTVVISPLVALMADQVAGLRSRGVESCAALNGLLSEPERADVLERVRLGDVAILIVSPEQLRNPGFRKAVEQREVGAWVMDEAHCLSKWGHDFRPDYRYVGRYIRESAGDGFRAPLLCLTATAKPDVVDDIRDYFRKELRATLRVFDGGANRDNLSYEVRETNPAQKLNDLNMLMEEEFGPDVPGGAIIYCAFRKTTEEVAKFL
ncbi:MAG TPA: DEAD/DEAH box helicase, partial [Candidatus Hydrogenedentes bacterium]|nr:DEAD/DEAH box helicase [Candidatus Hydrogenedentota bacterium]